ncbi:MAG: discoidin domain-containing protein, partial [Desulfobacterales bacterium]|nr:discoidin domain-containing protein [Desulfobacterales bacterium]
VAGDAVAMNGQSLCGMAWAITDLKDASGKPLTNDAVILGIRFNRSGTDPVGFFAVLPPARAAQEPTPADKATDVLRDVVVSWTPGQEAQSHDVYFGTVPADVETATRSSPLGVLVSQGQDANAYDPAGLLALGRTYYWRIDEIDASSQTTKGPIWSFTVEPVAYPITNVTATASSFQNAETGPGKTVDGSGLADDLHSATAEHMWLSNVAAPMPAWIQYEFDRVHKLQEMWVWNSNQLVEGVIGVGAKDATIEISTDGAAWTLLSDTQFAQGTGLSGYAHNTVVDFDGAVAKYVRLTIQSNWAGMLPQAGLSEVRFFSVPVLAREPDPASGSTGV